MIRHLLFRLSGRLPCRIISDGDRPYLERYYVGSFLGMRCYMHRFVASDPDRGMHNHPWRWAFSLVLAGWYTELNSYGTTDVRFCNGLVGDSFHRVLLPKRFVPITVNGVKYRTQSGESECWTLFFHRAGRSKDWGFKRHKGQMGWVYLPHYPQPGEREHWWTDAPVGRDCLNRMPEATA